MKYYFLISISIIALFTSCHKGMDPSNQSPNVDYRGISLFAIPDVISLSQEKLDGAIWVSGHNGIETGYPLNGSFEAHAQFLNANKIDYSVGNIQVDEKSIAFDNQKVKYRPTDTNQKAMRNSFGRTIEFSISPTSGFNSHLNSQLYLPQEMTEVRINGSLVKDDYFPLQRDATITWNPDPNNKRGVAIVIQFVPRSLGNQDLPASITQGIILPIITEDDGEYKLDPSKLAGFPDNAAVSLDIGRGNYTVESTSDNKRVILYGYSKVGGDLRLQAPH